MRAGPRVPVAIDRAARRGAESVKTAIFPRIPGTLPTAAAIQAVNQWAEKVRDEFLAPQVGLELGAFWLTALVVFSEPGTQARKILLFLYPD